MAYSPGASTLSVPSAYTATTFRSSAGEKPPFTSNSNVGSSARRWSKSPSTSSPAYTNAKSSSSYASGKGVDTLTYSASAPACSMAAHASPSNRA